MFKAELSDINVLKTSFEAISSIIDEVQIQVDSEGMRLNALDGAHVTFVHLELKAGLFDEYECDEPDEINIDSRELMSILKRSKSDDRVLMFVDEADFIITFFGDADRTFKIRLIDIAYEEPELPEVSHPVNLSVPVSVLKDCVKDVDVFSDKISLQVDEDYFMASAAGDFGDACFKYVHGENVSEAVKSVFTLSKVKDMLRADKFAMFANIGLGNDSPLSLSFNIWDNEGVLCFLLAPRLEKQE